VVLFGAYISSIFFSFSFFFCYNGKSLKLFFGDFVDLFFVLLGINFVS
jgi:hypothetical protein